MNKIGIILNDKFFENNDNMSISEMQLSSAFYNEISDNNIEQVIISVSKSLDNEIGIWSIPKSKAMILDRIHNTTIGKILFYIKIFTKSFFIDFPPFIFAFLPGYLTSSILPALILRKIPYAIYLRGDAKRDHFIYKVLFNSIIIKSFSKAKFIIASGPVTAQAAIPHNEIVEEEIPMMNVQKEDLFKRNSFSLSSPIRILFLSRIERDKGLYETIDALKQLIDEGLDIQIDFAGGGERVAFQAFDELDAKYKDRIIVHGKIFEKSKINNLFRKADIFIFPTYHEGFPRVLLEAMTFSTPIICSDIPAMRLSMKNGENCIKIRPKSYIDLKNAIIRLIKDEKLRVKIGNGGYEFMVAFFDRIADNTFAKQFLSLYHKTMKL